MKDFTLQSDLLKDLFNAIPALVLIIDNEGRITSINNTIKKFFNITGTTTNLRKANNILYCIQTKDDPEECGFHPACQNCILKQTGMKAINSNSVNRASGKLELHIDNVHKTIYYMISSAPLKYKGENMAIIILEDATTLIRLKGLIPICSSCSMVRDENSYWMKLESYIENLSDARFSHDICPECIKRFYPQYQADFNKAT